MSQRKPSVSTFPKSPAVKLFMSPLRPHDDALIRAPSPAPPPKQQGVFRVRHKVRDRESKAYVHVHPVLIMPMACHGARHDVRWLCRKKCFSGNVPNTMYSSATE
eukprot:5246818-Pyramimonas_sp.AAC.1